MSVGVSSLGKTSSHFVDLVAKIDGWYYRIVLLMEGLLPDIHGYFEYFTFQQDGAPAHRARETVELLKQAAPDFIPPSLPNSPDLNPSTTRCGGSYKSVCTSTSRSRTWKNCGASCRGGMEDCRPASDHWVAQVIDSLHCSWRRTFWTFTLNITAFVHILINMCFELC